MPGIWFYSLCFLLSVSLGAAAERSHEIQLRNNDYVIAADSLLLQANGFAKIIVRVFSDDEKNGGLYFVNSTFKTVRPVLDDWAPRFPHGKVGLWAWMGGRYFSWLKDSRFLDLEWRNGQRRIISKLDLFNPEAEQVIIGLFRQLAQKPIQGILIQDDLVLRRSEGFSNWGEATFTRVTGLFADEKLMLQNGSAHNHAWERIKCERVTQILEKLVRTCKTANPQIQIGMNIHYETPRAPGQARSWYAFDASAVSATGIDLFYLMAYHRQIKAEMKLGEGDNRIYFRLMLEAALKLWGAKLVVKLQVRDWRNSELIPFSELKTYYDLIPAGVERVCFAAADPEDIPLIEQIINPAK
jgi:biofilm PGA synthesis lipoprotein PgaB